MIVLLDAGPLGLAINPSKKNKQAEACTEWLTELLENAVSVCIPEISDYEVRRELKRANLSQSLRRLDDLIQARGIEYLPITTEIMLKASDLWARARQEGKVTSSDKALDGDVILAATAISASITENVVIATTNVKHLAWFATAKEWEKITTEDCLDSSNKKVKISLKAEVRPSAKH